MIAPVLRPSAAPIAPFDLPAAFNSKRCSSSPWLQGLLLFLGIRADCQRRRCLSNEAGGERGGPEAHDGKDDRYCEGCLQFLLLMRLHGFCLRFALLQTKAYPTAFVP
jgi:hypothetical protein